MVLFTLDWLEFTYKVPYSEETDLIDDFFDDFLEFDTIRDELVMLDYGLHGYSHVLRYLDEFMIMYNPSRIDMGVHVVFPGNSMHTLARLFGFMSVNEFVSCQSLFKVLKDRHCKPSRLDICFDDYQKIFRPLDFNRFYCTGRISTRMQHVSYISSKRNEGDTFYVGKRGKGRFLRIYDKNFESEGKIDAIRYEFEMRTDWALKIFDLVLEDQKFSFRTLLEDFMYITNEYDYNSELDPSVLNMRKFRAGVDPQWEKLLQLCEKLNFLDEEIDLKLPTKKSDTSYKKIHNWLNHAILRRLYQSYCALGQDKFISFVQSGAFKQKQGDDQLIKKYINERDEYWDWIEQLNAIGN